MSKFQLHTTTSLDVGFELLEALAGRDHGGCMRPPIIIQRYFRQPTTHFSPDPRLRLKVRVERDIPSLPILTHPSAEEHHTLGVGANRI